MVAVEHLVERHHVEEVHLIVELIFYIFLEVTDLAHDAVGVEQPAIGCIERLPDDGILEVGPVTFRQPLNLALLAFRFCLIDQCGNDAHGLAVLKLGEGVTVDVAPYRGALASKVGVPAVVPFRFCLAAAFHALNLRAELFQVVGMEASVIRLDAHFLTKHSLSEQVVHAIIL